MPVMRSIGAEHGIAVDFTAKKLHTRNSGSAIRWANDLRRRPEWCTHASLASTLASHGDGSVKIIRSEGSRSAFPVQRNFAIDKPATEGQCSLVECVPRTRGFVLIACQGTTPPKVVAAELRIRQSPRRLPSSEGCLAALDWADPLSKRWICPPLPPQIILSVRPPGVIQDNSTARGVWGNFMVVEDAAGGTDCALHYRQELGGISLHTISPYISWHCWHWPQFSTIIDSASSGRELDPAVRLSSPLGTLVRVEVHTSYLPAPPEQLGRGKKNEERMKTLAVHKHSAAGLLPVTRLAPSAAMDQSLTKNGFQLTTVDQTQEKAVKLVSATMPAAFHGDTTRTGISDPMSQTDRSLTNHQLDPPSFISGAIGEDTNQLVLNQGKQLRILACAGSHLHLFRPHYFSSICDILSGRVNLIFSSDPLPPSQSPACRNRQFDRCAKFPTQFRLLIGRRDPPLGPLSRALKYGALGTTSACQSQCRWLEIEVILTFFLFTTQRRANCLASGVFSLSLHLPSSAAMAGVNCMRNSPLVASPTHDPGIDGKAYFRAPTQDHGRSAPGLNLNDRTRDNGRTTSSRSS
ncbi:hypothetical protein M752DRAFT_283914 [Aspergillus phoenicis ATCC 13157]|uniref:Uncharacterized protein n=1 Tax=Aspergillus phoenicis ATCC 13157 TaxID=1353007 RepID=A0A370PK92_ASPPH|nr:hypothetical protein M747DRAFT_314936 [Aspergillus niger ATCC 13496]RDK42618.1 hypothetical protein M752DRAFT_283914 [Aspergillus phoenicis ATCC 13157]